MVLLLGSFCIQDANPKLGGPLFTVTMHNHQKGLRQDPIVAHQPPPRDKKNSTFRSNQTRKAVTESTSTLPIFGMVLAGLSLYITEPTGMYNGGTHPTPCFKLRQHFLRLLGHKCTTKYPCFTGRFVV